LSYFYAFILDTIILFLFLFIGPQVNPTQCEMLTMVCARVFGNSNQVTFAASQGQMQLNVFKPCMVAATLQSIRLLSDACITFADHCISGLRLDENHIKDLVNRSLMLVTALNPIIGYEKAAKVSKLAHKMNITLKEAAVDELKFLSAEEFDTYVDASKMLRPHSVASIRCTHHQVEEAGSETSRHATFLRPTSQHGKRSEKKPKAE